MKIILGLNIYHADASACIIKNGRLLFAIEEERINRIKHWAGLPTKAINECLKNTSITINEITDIAINTSPLSNIFPKSLYFLRNYLTGKKKIEIYKRIKKKLNLVNDLNTKFYPIKLSNKIKVHYVDHHKSHIASAFYPSGFSNAVGLSLDGFGDFCSLAISKCNKSGIKIIDRVYFPDSLGIFYEAFTQFLGFKNYGDEYKIMGLSSYGSPIYYDLIKKNLFKDNKSFQLNLKFFNHTNKNYKYNFNGYPKQKVIFKNNIKKLFAFQDSNQFQNLKFKKNLASSIQKIFEDHLINICKKIKDLKYSKNLVYAGGCALNSLANKKIFESRLFNKVFIPYAPGDGGGSIGAALTVLKDYKKDYKFYNLKNPYIGPKYKNSDISKELLKNKKLNIHKISFENNNSLLLKKVAKYIYQNRVVGFFNDRMEFGARALGNRSILANPCNPKIRDLLNKKIKKRETFRPFAPAILNDHKSKWFGNIRENAYMSCVENIVIKNRKYIPAVTHIDGTGRVQTVKKSINKNFYGLIKEFYKLSNVPILLNTSFNENEPIVMNYKHAIDCFLRTKMDVLVINNFIIKRK